MFPFSVKKMDGVLALRGGFLLPCLRLRLMTMEIEGHDISDLLNQETILADNESN